MDKKTFYEELKMRLKNLGVRSDYIEKHINQFEKYFQDKTTAQIEEDIASLGDLDRVASRIKRATDKMLLAESGIPVDDASSSAGIPSQNTEEKPAEAPAPARDGDDLYKPAVKINEPEVLPENVRPLNDDTSKRLKTARVDDDELKGRLLTFRIAFFVSLPIVFAFVLLTMAFFGLLYFSIALIIIGAVVALGAVAIAGTAIAFLGIVLGIVKMFSAMPAGLFECGLSVMVGAAAMFVGILIYNFAVRLMPWLAGLLLKFAKFVFKKYKTFYVFVKKECVKL